MLYCIKVVDRITQYTQKLIKTIDRRIIMVNHLAQISNNSKYIFQYNDGFQNAIFDGFLMHILKSIFGGDSEMLQETTIFSTSSFEYVKI